MSGTGVTRGAAVWTLANRLGVVAGTPAELLSALLAGPPRTVRVDLAPDDDLVHALRALGHLDVVATGPPPSPAPCSPQNLDDPAAVCAADPLSVTEAYESGTDPHGGLRAAWLRAGQALIRDGQTPAGRALVLLTALDDTADPRLAPALAESAAGQPWHLAWSRRTPGTALTTTPDGRLVVADEPRATAVACLPDGTRLALDERGRLHTRGGQPTRLTEAVTATLARHPATALATAGPTVLTGDRMGTVHAFGLGGVDQAALHPGRVTALAASASTAYSGGTDGTVRAWRPRRAPARRPVAARPHPVVALHAADRFLAVAWADGLAELHGLGTRRVLRFRPGPRIRAVAVTGDGSLVVGLDDVLLCLAQAERSCG
ncbi:hypothetical protein AB0A69_31150 [Streptomyces sp. NPDC045431]|uniref:hypothetical protein n=1 Tax=Streptomyces sp. NPDC045431 TaxID=3155613 RepID=UPI003410F089